MQGIEGFSRKQLQVLTWWSVPEIRARYDAVLCDGAVRSGKTLCMGLSFVLWALWEHPQQEFALCGKTILALRRNLVDGLMGRLRGMGIPCRFVAARNLLEVGSGQQWIRCHLFGGRDEASADHIQGMTLAGVLFDEAALLPRSFVEQALARCSVAGAVYWFSCNPEHPNHWFYREWVCKTRERRVLYLHFTMQDNPSLSPKVRQRYERLYSGDFYRRFILGEWVAPQGLVYPMFSPQRHLRRVSEKSCTRFAVSCDYGTLNPMSMGLWGNCGGVWHRLRESYHDGRETGIRRTDEEHYAALEELVGELPVEVVIVDPSAASFLQCVRAHGRFAVLPADNRVREGIAAVGAALQRGSIAFDPSCKDTIREFSLYRWEEKSGMERPCKEDDHSMDDIRYFVMWAFGKGRTGGFSAAAVQRKNQ